VEDQIVILDDTRPEIMREDVMDSIDATQAEVKALLDRWSEACRTKDIDRLMPLYGPDNTYFDLVPPLQYSGADAVRRNFLRWFDSWESEIGVEVRNLKIVVSGDVAFAYLLHRTSGTLKNGQEVGYWVRATVCCQRSNHQWLITHEHISLPVDPRTRSAAMDLVP
jgi:ketosteroid isomerase-like protein